MYSEHYPIYTPLLSEGLGEASSLPLSGRVGVGLHTSFCGSPAINCLIFCTHIAISRSRASRVAQAM